jgi:transposase InsO family protein
LDADRRRKLLIFWRATHHKDGQCSALVHTADLAAEMITQACRDGQIDPRGLDNGKPMRASTMLATLQWLGVVPSFSRPHASDDNPYSEALFRTLKYTPAYPRLPFANLAIASAWVTRFVSCRDLTSEKTLQF